MLGNGGLTTWVELVIAAATLALAIVGAFLVHGYRRRMRFELAKERLRAYGRLFEITERAAPTRIDQFGENGALTARERERLYVALTHWYYERGNGMLLEAGSRDLYLKAKSNLLCVVEKIEPPEAWESITDDLPVLPTVRSEDTVRGIMSIRQFSLLRTQLKRDLAIFGRPYSGRLAQHELAFLESCPNVGLKKPPWEEVVSAPKRVERAESITSRVP